MTTFWGRVAFLYEATFKSITWSERQLAITEGFPGRVWNACCGMGTLAVALRSGGRDVCSLDLSLFPKKRTVWFWLGEASTSRRKKTFLIQLYSGGFIPLEETKNEIVFGLIGWRGFALPCLQAPFSMR